MHFLKNRLALASSMPRLRCRPLQQVENVSDEAIDLAESAVQTLPGCCLHLRISKEFDLLLRMPTCDAAEACDTVVLSCLGSFCALPSCSYLSVIGMLPDEAWAVLAWRVVLRTQFLTVQLLLWLMWCSVLRSFPLSILRNTPASTLANHLLAKPVLHGAVQPFALSRRRALETALAGP